MKKLLIAVIAIVLLVVLGVAAVLGYVYMNRNELARRGTEKVMSFVLLVNVTVQGADVDIKNGTVELTGINIPNPEGFDTEQAMYFGTVRVKADLRSFRTDTPVINEITVADSKIVLEAKTTGGTNLQKLTDNAARLSTGEEKPPKEGEKSYKIEHVYINGTNVQVALPLSGGRTVGVTIPDIHLEDLGGEKEEGVTPAEAIQEFLAAILAKIKEQGAGIIPADILNGIGDTLKGLPDDLQKNVEGILSGVGTTAEDASKSLEGAAQDAQKAAEDTAKEVEGALRGILGTRERDNN